MFYCVCSFICSFFFLMIRRPPRSTRTDTLFPYTTLFRSGSTTAYRLIDFAPQPRSVGVTVEPTRFRARRLVLADRAAAGYSFPVPPKTVGHRRSEEHTSELQSLMRISYAVFCLKKKTIQKG